MKPVKMTLCGWGPYKGREEIPFDRLSDDLFLVTGATGAGKTTIFDGIIYALYGRVSGEIRERESVRSDFCIPTDETYVNLLFSHNGKTYEITRSPKYLRPKKRGGKEGELVEEKEKARLTIYHEDGSEKTVEGVNDVTKAVEEILRLDERQFKQTTMIAQGEFTKLLFASPKDKTEIFRNLFGTRIYELFTKKMRAEGKELEGKIRFVREIMEDTVSQLTVNDDKWQALLQEKSHHYGQMKDSLSELVKRENKNLKSLQKESEEAEANEKALLEQYNRAEETEKRFAELAEAEKSLHNIESQTDEMNGLREQLKQAEKVAKLLPVNNRMELLQRQYDAEVKREKELCKQMDEKTVSQKEIMPFHENERCWKEWLALSGTYVQHRISLKEVVEKREEAVCFHEKQKKLYLKKEAEKEQVGERYRALVTTRQRAAVGIVAAQLKEGMPCPVCGSMEHPKVAEVSDEIPDEETLKKAQEKEEEARKEFEKVLQTAGAAKEKLNQISEQEEILQKTAEEEKEELERQFRTHKILSQLFDLSEESFEKFLELPAEELQKKKDAMQIRGENALEKWYALERELHALTERLSDVKNQKEETWEALFSQGQDFMLTCQETFGKKQEKEVYISTIRQYEKSEEWIQSVRGKLEEYSAKYQSALDRKKRCLEICETLERADMEELQNKLQQADKKKKELSVLCHEKQEQIYICRTAEKKLEKKLSEEAVLQEKYGVYHDIASVAEGKNDKYLVFEQYVLAYFFEDILKAANKRFGSMSNGRYILKRAKEVGDGRSRDNLEMVVHDYYTGKIRSVKTLSGGESFQAALSLALGMSDVIQHMSGGIRVETLFLDEGFGALDAEALNQACETLISLADQNIFIGVISHVEELKERIRCQIQVERTNQGSHVSVRVS